MAATRPALRSAMASFRTSASRLGTKSKTKPTSSPFQLPNAKPTRILRSSPVELSCCVDSMMPFHTATSSALLTSLISVSRTACWLPEGLKLNSNVCPVHNALAGVEKMYTALSPLLESPGHYAKPPQDFSPLMQLENKIYSRLART